jgi:hypothetical protein
LKKLALYFAIVAVFTGLLMLRQNGAFAESPPVVVKTLLFEEGYLEHELSKRKVLVLEDVDFYAEQDEKLPPLGKLSAGETISVLGGNYYVAPTKVVVLEDHLAQVEWPTPVKYQFRAGEVFYIINYLGEGVFQIWRNDQTIRVDLRGIKGLAVYGSEPNYWGMLAEEAKWHQGKAWVQIKTADGQPGWVVWSKAFGNTKIDGYRGIYIFLNGKYISEFMGYGKNQYRREEGKILLPLDAAASLIGASVNWNSDSTVATVTYRASSLKIIPGKRIGIQNGDPVDFEFAPDWRGTTFFVPLQRFYEALGAKAFWDDEARKFSIELTGK